MNRLLLFSALALLAVASIVLAQSPQQATLRTPEGEWRIGVVQEGGQMLVSAGDVISALGGTLTPESTGFRVTLKEQSGAFGPDSRFAVAGDDLIEMPLTPVVVEGQPYVPWQFFESYLSRVAGLETIWDPAALLLTVRPRQLIAVPAQIAVTHLGDISKVVVTLAAPVEYAMVEEAGAYLFRFSGPVAAPFAEQSYDDPHVARASFSENALRIHLTSPQVAGDSYRLDNPFRIVLDVRKVSGQVPAPATPVPGGRRPGAPLGIRTIVIDPGHGGKEVGAVGPTGLMEKDVTLVVARKLAAALGSRLGARVVLTRDDDSLVSLDQRTALANHFRADLFLSVHMNAAVVRDAKGSETYFLSLEASDELARRAAEIENAAGGSGSDDDLKLILWDLAHQEYLQESSRFAQAIQEEMNRATGVQNRGVKQAPFKVLLGATMPAALVEVGFISNPEEEARLQSDGFQDLMVNALVGAIERYKNDYETRIGLIEPVRTPPPVAGGLGSPAPPPQGRTGT
ncbi:MAG TPA: N-acetylmuramoyl-L-alanine amidase [Thermoanaerobaculia bacterium]|nr:N-acetylmuramoyl-L-alanine amidase [Thermoanaerobaculia bacterium]